MYKKLFILLLFILSAASYCHSQERNKLVLPEINSIDLTFTGSKSYTVDELMLNVLSRSGTYFKADALAQDITRLKKFYFDRGFFKIAIDSSITHDVEDNEVEIELKISENERSYVKKVEYLGLDSIDPHCRLRILEVDTSISAGMPYEKSKVDAEAARVTFLLQTYGYAYVDKKKTEIEYQISDRDKSNQNVVIKLNFRPGEIYYFGKTSIEIERNDHGVTKDELNKYFKFSEGEKYDKDKLNKTESGIATMPIVEIVKFEPDGVKNNVINYKLKIRLRNKYELKPELAGMEINNLFYGGAGLSFYDRHFFGGGRLFTASVINLYHSPEINILEAEAEIIQPYLFGNERITGRAGVSGTYTNLELFSLLGITYQAGIGFKFPQHTYFNEMSFDWELSNLYFKTNVALISNDEEEIIEPFDINVFLSTLGFTLKHDRVNNPMLPTRGFYQALEVKESGLLGSLFQSLVTSETYKYFKARLLNKYFFDLTGRGTSVMGMKFLTGIVIDYDGSLELLNTKFSAGGPSSHRGWRSNSLGMFENKELGGNFLIEGSFEHRFYPFTDMLGYIKDLGFATFIDYGNVWNDIKAFRWDEVALSTGAGFRYNTLVGTVRFDVGFKLYDPRPGHVGVTNWIFQKGANFRDKYNIQIGVGNSF